MTETTPSPLGNVITIDDERIKSHLDRVVRGSVEETLNALLDAEADRLCNAQRYERRSCPLRWCSSAAAEPLGSALQPRGSERAAKRRSSMLSR
jgi:hypothetical protein